MGLCCCRHFVGREGSWRIDDPTCVSSSCLISHLWSPLSLFIRFHTNSAPATFWFILYCVLTPGLYHRVMDEITPAFLFSNDPNKPPKLNLDYLLSPKTCPLFHSVYTETLRLVSATVSVRAVDEATEIGGYTLGKGAKVFCPGRPLQIASEFWGGNADLFDPDRFLKRPQEGQSMKMRPFGGGPTLCPGRFWLRDASRVVLRPILSRPSLCSGRSQGIRSRCLDAL